MVQDIGELRLHNLVQITVRVLADIDPAPGRTNNDYIHLEWLYFCVILVVDGQQVQSFAID